MQFALEQLTTEWLAVFTPCPLGTFEYSPQLVPFRKYPERALQTLQTVFATEQSRHPRVVQLTIELLTALQPWPAGMLEYATVEKFAAM